MNGGAAKNDDDNNSPPKHQHNAISLGSGDNCRYVGVPE